jgi:hypothetical protein
MNAPMTRRAVFARIAGAAALTLPAAALSASPADPNAEIVALSAEIVSRAEQADRFRETRIDPFQQRFFAIFDDLSKPRAEAWEAACAYSREVGREAAIDAHGDFEQATDGLFKRMMALTATTQAGRAAKVRALFAHVMRGGWRGPAADLDWDKEMARALLGEFAGMSATELEAI